MAELRQKLKSEIFSAFSVYDKDGDGTIRYKDVERVMKELIGFDINEKKLNDMITDVAVENYNGILDFPEFMTLYQNVQKYQNDIENEITGKLSIYQKKNEDNFISPIELKKILENLSYQLTNEQIEEILEKVKPNNSHPFSKSETLIYQEIIRTLMQILC